MITQNKQSEQIPNMLFKISKATITSESVTELIGKIRVELKKQMVTTDIYMAIYDEERDELTTPYFNDEKGKISSSYEAVKTLTEMVVKQNKQLILYRNDIVALCKSRELIPAAEVPDILLGSPLQYGDKVLGAIVVQDHNKSQASDESILNILSFVSDHIALSLCRKKMEIKMEKALEAARESDNAKSDFLKNMSHELRTPLNAIIGFSTLLNTEKDLKDVKEYAGFIRKGGERLLTTVENLFEAVEIESGNLTMEFETFSLNELLQSVTRIVNQEREEFGKQNIDLKINLLSIKSDILLISDKNRIQQTLLILLRNALKFTKKGEIRLEVYRIESYNLEWVEISVKDTGIGIPIDKQKNIYQFFSQVDNSINRKYEGLGLGLYIAKKVVNKLGGKLLYEPNKPEGSVFRLRIPLIEGGTFSKKNWVMSQYHSSKTTKKETVVIATDDESNYNLMSTILQINGLYVMRAKSGIDALRICLENSYVRMTMFDSKFLEVEDFRIVETIRKQRKEVPVVLLADKNLNGDLMEIKNKYDDFVEIPIQQKKFNMLIKRWL